MVWDLAAWVWVRGALVDVSGGAFAEDDLLVEGVVADSNITV